MLFGRTLGRSKSERWYFRVEDRGRALAFTHGWPMMRSLVRTGGEDDYRDNLLTEACGRKVENQTEAHVR
jgi:hypothetical protein